MNFSYLGYCFTTIVKEINQTDQYLVSLSSKTYVVSLTCYFFLCTTTNTKDFDVHKITLQCDIRYCAL